VATNRRVSALERQNRVPNNPVSSLVLGVIGALAWAAAWAVLKALFGDNLKVSYEGKEILLRAHPQFEDLTLAILVCGLIFIMVVTMVNMIIVIWTNRRPQPQQVQHAQGNPPPQGGNHQAGGNLPTQVMPQPVNAGQQGL
jgi:drug/metabolite transporter (DMT)-like permease